MFVVKLKGGLGNQMFQYALAKSLLLNSGDSVFFDTSFSHYRSETKRQYSLYCFQIDKKLKIMEVMDLPWIFQDPIADFGKKIFMKLRLKGLFMKDWRYFLERQNIYNPEIKELSGKVYLDGYWQSQKYFSDFRQQIIRELTLKEYSTRFKELSDLMMRSQSVSLHVRRGDYISNPSASSEHNLCPLEYYQQAIKLVTEKINNPVFFIFSDDITWVLKNINFGTVEIHAVSGNGLKDCEELILMSHCRHQIIANSSFSWWGAWLNQNPDKMVIAPKNWLRNDPQPKDLIPDNWIKL